MRLSQIWSADGSFADDEGRDIDDLRAEAAAAGLQRVFQLPIELGCEMWGVVEFYARESQPHDSDLLSTMATIASQIRQFVERMEAEAALHQARDQLAHVTRVASLGELTASIAHEVNQPLTGIVANANAALRWLAHSPPEMGEAIEALRRLARDGKRAGEVIARLRTLVRKGEQSRKSPLDANQVVRETLPLIRSELQQNEVAVSLSLSRDLAQVRADRVQLQQVVLNLIVNAVEALAGQPGRPRELAISTRNQDEQVMIAVTDNGIGLSNENTERIFDPFFTTKPQGLGMGLAISRSIVEDHGGKLSVTSDRTGTTFEIKLRASR